MRSDKLDKSRYEDAMQDQIEESGDERASHLRSI